MIKKVCLTTTFATLKKRDSNIEPYNKLTKALGGVRRYGWDTQINLLTILKHVDVDYMVWCLGDEAWGEVTQEVRDAIFGAYQTKTKRGQTRILAKYLRI